MKKKHAIKLSAVALASLLSASLLNGQTFASNSSETFASSVASLGAGAGVLPPAIQNVVNNLTGYRTTEEGINTVLTGVSNMASGAVTAKEGEITTKITDINALISANPLDPQIAVEQGNLVTLQADLGTLQGDLAAAQADVQNSDIKIALYQNAIDNPVAAAQAAAAAAAAAITDARDQYAAGADATDPDYVKTGDSGLQGVIDTIEGVAAGDPAAVTLAITNADAAFPGAAAASLADIQALVGVIDAELPNLPPISNVNKDQALATVMNGSYERQATDVIATGGIEGIITKKADGSIHIGENSFVLDDSVANHVLTIDGVGTKLVLGGDAPTTAAVESVNIEVANNLGVIGNTDLTTVTATGLASLNGGLAVTGGTTTDTLTATGASITNGITNNGNIATGTLGTTGLATLNSAQVSTTLDVTGATTTNGITNNGIVTTDALTVNNNGTVGGTLGVTGLVSANGGLAVTGGTTTDTLTVTGASNTNGITNNGNIATGTLGTTGLATLNSASVTNNLAVGGNTDLNGALDVQGAANFQSTLTVSDLARFNGGINADNGLFTVEDGTGRVYSDDDIQARLDIFAGRDLDVGRNAQIDGDTNIDGVLSLGDNGFGGVTDVARAINSNTNQIARNKKRIDENSRGIAMVAALQHTTVLPGMTNALDVGAAYFEGETGMSINYARRINENWQINFGAASTTDFDESVIKAGVGVQW